MESLECNFIDQGRIVEATEDRASPWYNQYHWAVSWTQYEIGVLRQSRDSYKITQNLSRRRHWETYRTQQTVSKITMDVENRIQQVARYFDSITVPFKTVYSQNAVTVYVNDKDTADAIAKFAQSITLSKILIREANLNQPVNTIVLKRPYDYTYRTWFRSRKFDDNTKQVLNDWVTGMNGHVHASPSLKRWLTGKRPNYISAEWTCDYYFVDHNDSKLDVWVAMVCPGIVRKTVSIQSPAK